MKADRLQQIRDWHENGGDSLAHQLVGELLAHVAELRAARAPKPAPKPAPRPRRESADPKP